MVIALALAAASAWLGVRSGAAEAEAADHRLDEATQQLERARRDVVRSSLDAIVVRAGVFAGELGRSDLDRSESSRSSTWAEAGAVADAIAVGHPSLAADAEALAQVIDETETPALLDLFEAAGVAEFDVLAGPVDGQQDQLAFIDNAFTLVMYEAFVAEADRTAHRTDLLGVDDLDYLAEEVEFISMNPGYLGPDRDDPLADSWVLPELGPLDSTETAWRNEVSGLVSQSSTWITEQWTISWADGRSDPPPMPLVDVFIETEQSVAIVRGVTDGRLATSINDATTRTADSESAAARLRIGALVAAGLAALAGIGATTNLVRRFRQAGALVTTDELTGVGNRRRLQNSRAALADPTLRHHAVVVIDLDRFKLVNDTHGHLVGDRVLVEMATQLEVFGRDSGMKQHEIIRLGGDEFAVTLHHDQTLDIPGLEARLEAIQAFAVVTNDGERVLLEFSYGIVDLVGSAGLLEDLLDAADLRAYEDKQRRRDNRARTDATPSSGQAVDLTLPTR